MKDQAKFEFFAMMEHAGRWRSYFFGVDQDLAWWEGESHTPAGGLTPIEFLGHSWLKPADHDAFLTACYGDWRIVRKDYHYMTDDRSIVARRRCPQAPCE